MTEHDEEKPPQQGRRVGPVRWEPARPAQTHAIGVGPEGLEALRKLGRKLAEKRAAENDGGN
jgi:hypothetical protein